MTINLPYSGLGFAVGPIVRVPREATAEELERYRQAVEDVAQHRHRAAPTRAPAPTRRAPRPGAARGGASSPACRLKSLSHRSPACARPVAPLAAAACASGAARRSRSGATSGWASPARRGRAGRLAWFHAASVGETNAILPLMAALAEERPSLSFLLTTGTVTSAKLAAAAARAARHPSVRAARCAGVRARLPRPLAAGSGGLHRVRRSGPT